MSGRQEMDDKYRVKTEKLLEGCNKIIRAFYVDFKTTKTMSTCFEYVKKLKTYFEYLEDFDDIEDVTYEFLGSLKPTDINLFLDWYKYNNGKEKSDGTMAYMYNILNAFFKYLELNDYIEKNPCAKLKAQKVRVVKAPVSLTEEEVKRVADYILYGDGNFYGNKYEKALRSRDYLMFMLGCRTGLRISAICAIDISDIDFNNNSLIVIEKEKETREIYFGESTKKLLLDWIALRNEILGDEKVKTDALFITLRKARMGSPAAREALEKYLCIIEGKHLTPHKLRATCAQKLWEETADLYLVATILGHKNVNTTKRYTGVDAKHKKKAANILDGIF